MPTVDAFGRVPAGDSPFREAGFGQGTPTSYRPLCSVPRRAGAWRLAAAGLLAAGCLVADAAQAGGPSAGPLQAPLPETASTVHREVLDRYCVTCHNAPMVRGEAGGTSPLAAQLRAAGLTLDTLDLDAVGERAEVWERVVRKLRAGMMPPAGRPRPKPGVLDELAGWLEDRLDAAARRRPDPAAPPPCTGSTAPSTGTRCATCWPSRSRSRIPSADGTTPLMVAAGVAIFIPGEDGGSLPGQEDEVLEAVRMCVEAGTDVDAVNERRETALHGAAFRGVNAVVDYLVEQGAALDARTVEGWTPLALANGLSYSDFFKAQTHTADRLRALMEARGLDTAGHDIDPAVCLDCFQTRPDQVRAAIARDERMAAELAAGQR